MPPKKLKLTHDGNVITIRKRPVVWLCVFFLFVFGCMLILPLLLPGAWSYPLFWGCIALCWVGNTVECLRLMLGTVILDTAAQKLTVKGLWPSTCDFSSVDGITTYYREGDSEGGMERNKVCIHLIRDRQILVVHTTSREQSKELAELVELTIRETLFPPRGESDE